MPRLVALLCRARVPARPKGWLSVCLHLQCRAWGAQQRHCLQLGCQLPGQLKLSQAQGMACRMASLNPSLHPSRRQSAANQSTSDHADYLQASCAGSYSSVPNERGPVILEHESEVVSVVAGTACNHACHEVVLVQCLSVHTQRVIVSCAAKAAWPEHAAACHSGEC